MATRELGIIMHGITGRMGYNQHLNNSILAIMKDGGIPLSNGDKLFPKIILLGRNKAKLKKIAEDHQIEHYTTDYDACLANKEYEVFFDAGATKMRPGLIEKALAAGKHVYCEKPIGLSLEDSLAVCRKASASGLKTGIVMDKLYLPGLQKLKQLVEEDFFGQILSIKIDFGYWVFTGEEDKQPAQRPSWNYRKEDGGSIIFDMMCHWRYVLDHIVAPVKSVSCLGAVNFKKRWDEENMPYIADADDAFYAMLKLDKGIIAQINSSWCTRVNRDDLVTFQIDGSKGSAVAGLTNCKIQRLADTPRPVWNPDAPQQMNFYDQWEEYQPRAKFKNGFRAQWEEFLLAAVEGKPYAYTLNEGAKGVQLAELSMKSWELEQWMQVDDLSF